MAYWEPAPWDISGDLRGRPLRYMLVSHMMRAGRPLTVAELIQRCEADGVIFSARASKLISDALRWEVRRGRVRRVARGVYAFGGAPSSTIKWIRRRVRNTITRLEWAANERFMWWTGQRERVSHYDQQHVFHNPLKT